MIVIIEHIIINIDHCGNNSRYNTSRRITSHNGVGIIYHDMTLPLSRVAFDDTPPPLMLLSIFY